MSVSYTHLLEFNDAEGMQDQLDFAFDPEMPGDEEDDQMCIRDRL